MNIKQALAFEQALYKLINTSGLSVETAYYILKSVYLDLQKTVYDCARTQKENDEHIDVNINKEEMENERDITADFGSNDDN